MLGVVITLAVIAAVAWCIFKNYYPPTVLLIAHRITTLMQADCTRTEEPS